MHPSPQHYRNSEGGGSSTAWGCLPLAFHTCLFAFSVSTRAILQLNNKCDASGTQQRYTSDLNSPVCGDGMVIHYGDHNLLACVAQLGSV